MHDSCDTAALTVQDEIARIAAVRDYRALDEEGGHRLDDIAALASRLCCSPVAVAGLVGVKRTFVVSAIGIPTSRAARLDLLCRHAIAQSGIFEIPDATLDPRFSGHALVTATPSLRFFAAAPLCAPLGHAVGALCVAHVEPRQLTIEQHGALAILARLAVGQLELGLIALRDPLTGLYHRARLDAILARALANTVRHRLPLSVIGVDVDSLRRINETCGVIAGDAVLRAVSSVLTCDANPRNVACRLAGRRFVIVMPGTDTSAAAARAEALRRAVTSLDLNIAPGVRPRITISAGVATCPEDGATPEELLAAAGRALGLASAHGGNRVEVAPRELEFSTTGLHAIAATDRRGFAANA